MHKRIGPDIEILPAGPTELSSSAAFLQTGWWAAFKAGHGWKSLAFSLRGEGEPDRPLSVLLRRLPLGLTLAYIPHGPSDKALYSRPDFPSLLARISTALAPHLPSSTLCLRWDLLSGVRVDGPAGEGTDDELRTTRDPFPAPLGRPFRKPSADVQPADTVVVALDADDETLLARMHKKTRYNIRLAEKKNVIVEKAGVDALSDWYALYKETAERDKISIHSEAYYRDLFGLAPDLTLWLARFEGRILAGNIVLLHQTTATYLYGASSNQHRNLMAPYALQWAAMRDCRDRGALEYDLFGIPPTDDPQHPMHGLYRFKTGFGGARIHRHGAWDFVLRPGAWRLWVTLDALRVWYYKVWKKR